MKKHNPIYYYLASMLLLLLMNGCRESFTPDFADVEIKNAPPTVSEIGQVTLTPGFGTYMLDLSTFIKDQEGDNLTLQASSGNDAVCTVEIDGTSLEIIEEGEGTSTIAVTVTDGNEGNSVDFTFNVVIAVPGFQYYFLFDEADGTDVNGLVKNGVTFGVEGAEGASAIIEDGVVVWTVPEYSAITLEFAEPVDLSENSLFQFNYADMWEADIWFAFEDANGVGIWDIPLHEEFEFMLDMSNFNTFDEFYLGDFAEWAEEPIDMSQITFIYFEKAAGETDPPSVWRMDNLFISSTE